MMRNQDYYKLPTDCVTPTRIPGIPDKSIMVGDFLELDFNDVYTMP
jgi:hypothetical protein